jgi:hypothetical protein
MRTRRLILPFFSIPVTEAWPISPVRAMRRDVIGLQPFGMISFSAIWYNYNHNLVHNTVTPDGVSGRNALVHVTTM